MKGWLHMAVRQAAAAGRQVREWVASNVTLHPEAIRNDFIHFGIPIFMVFVSGLIFTKVRRTAWGESLSMLGICIVALVPLAIGGVLFGLTTNLGSQVVH